MRKPLISANWKMNHNHFEAIQTVQKLAYLVGKDELEAADVSIHPPFTDIRSVQTVIDSDKLGYGLGAQHCHFEEKGAYTGEVSPVFLAKLGVKYVIGAWRRVGCRVATRPSEVIGVNGGSEGGTVVDRARSWAGAPPA